MAKLETAKANYTDSASDLLSVILDQMPTTEQQKVQEFMGKGCHLRLASTYGLRPDVTLTLVDPQGLEHPVYSLIGRNGEVEH